MEPFRIFVSGPYCPRDCGEHDYARVAQQNVDRAIEVGNMLADRGHYVFIPHLQHFMHIHHSCHKNRGEWYNEVDLTFLELWADALYFIASSPGADVERKRAYDLCLPVFTRIVDVPYVRRLDATSL